MFLILSQVYGKISMTSRTFKAELSKTIKISLSEGYKATYLIAR